MTASDRECIFCSLFVAKTISLLQNYSIAAPFGTASFTISYRAIGLIQLMRLIDTLARRCVQAYVVVVQRFHDEAALSCTPSLKGSKVNRSQRMRTILKLQGELHIVSDSRDHTYSCFNMHINLSNSGLSNMALERDRRDIKSKNGHHL